MSHKEAFLQRLNERTTSWSAAYPEFDVFSVTDAKLRECIADLDDAVFSAQDYEIMGRLRKALVPNREAVHWALAYIDLWFCANFHQAHWGPLVTLDRANIKFAIQAACYVWHQSSNDSSIPLARLVRDSDCWDEALPQLEKIGWV